MLRYIFDLRRGAPYAPMRDAFPRHTIDGAAFAADMGPGYADEQLVAFLSRAGGVRLLADVPGQVVLLTSLLSMRYDVRGTARDAMDLEAKGFICSCDWIPFWPLRINPQGMVLKAGSDPPVYRSVCDGGCPRDDMVDDAGVRVVSLNASADAAGRPPERKPTTTVLAADFALLRAYAACTGEQVFGFTIDFAAYFHQFGW